MVMMNKDTWSASPLDHCLARVAQDKMTRVQGSTWWILSLIDNVIFLIVMRCDLADFGWRGPFRPKLKIFRFLSIPSGF